MKVVAVTLARFAAFLEVQGLDPKGRTSTLRSLQALGKYSFAKVPQTFQELDFEKGIELIDGRFEDVTIDKLTVYTNGVAVDTHSSTDDCQAILDDFLSVFREAFGATIKPYRHFFVSQVVFHSDVKLCVVHPILQVIADKVATATERDMGQPISFEASSISVGSDLSRVNVGVGPFTIERRMHVPFSENMYFSSAPLETKAHLNLLQDVESALAVY